MIIRKVTLEGTPEQLQKQLNQASKVDRRIYRKQWEAPNRVSLWYRAETTSQFEGTDNDLVTAIRDRAEQAEQPERKRRKRKAIGDNSDGASDLADISQAASIEESEQNEI